MTLSIPMVLFAATYGAKIPPAEPTHNDSLDAAVAAVHEQLRTLIATFHGEPTTPVGTYRFERDLQAVLQELGRRLTQVTYNRLASDAATTPSHATFEREWYTRVRTSTPQNVWTLFGQIRVQRFGYRPSSAGEPMWFPVAHQLGLVHGASPALVDRVGQWMAEAGATQQRVLARLRAEHGVGWGVKKLRQVTETLSDDLVVHQRDAQVEPLLAWLTKAEASTGRHKPVLCVGRDGVSMRLRIRKGSLSEMASTGTVSVYDRRGQRLGTIYLAHTPEPGQPAMTQSLNDLLREVLNRWTGGLPRLAYVTDAGDNETRYYESVLRGMTHPRTQAVLDWVRVVDYYHASERIWTLAAVLFADSREAASWARKMLKWLLAPGGVNRVLHSAAAWKTQRTLTAPQTKEYRKAYHYLRSRMAHMDYARYRRVGVPQGSGVTEAGCKTVFTQRLKQSGMCWTKAGARTILTLRVILLSGVWEDVYGRLLAARPQPVMQRGQGASAAHACEIAA